MERSEVRWQLRQIRERGDQGVREIFNMFEGCEMFDEVCSVNGIVGCFGGEERRDNATGTKTKMLTNVNKH